MVSRGIRLVHLSFVGADLAPARVEFGPGLNVVWGASDTGKTFIARAIDFMLGASILKEIPELVGYSHGILCMLLPNGSITSFCRRVDGAGGIDQFDGDLRTVPNVQPMAKLATSHNGKNYKNISKLLLNEIDLDHKKIRVDANNKLRDLSLRDVVRLNIIHEEAMLSASSPVLTGQYQSETVDKSAVKVLIEGEDDSALPALPSAKETRTISKAKIEALNEAIDRLRSPDTASESDLEQRMSELEERTRRYFNSYSEISSQRDAISRDASDQAQAIERLSATVRQHNEFVSRFSLLASQYVSDLARLDMIQEAGTLLGFFHAGFCPFCGAPEEHQRFVAHAEGETTLLADSVMAERNRIVRLQGDLEATITGLRIRADEAEAERSSRADRYGQMIEQLEIVEDQLRPIQIELEKTVSDRSKINAALAAHTQIAGLEELRGESNIKPEKRVSRPVVIAREGADAVVAAAERLLREWEFPFSTISLDEETLDLVVDGQSRANRGKGTRALLHSLYTLALVQSCIDRSLGFLGVVVLDSPLITYRPPDRHRAVEPPDEEPLDPSIGDSFYASLSRLNGIQVIVFENVGPPSELDEDAVTIHFTGEPGFGRFGFFPSVKAHAGAGV